MDYFAHNKTIRTFLSNYQSKRWPKLIKLLTVYAITNLQKNNVLNINEDIIFESTKKLMEEDNTSDMKKLTNQLDHIKKKVASFEKLIDTDHSVEPVLHPKLTLKRRKSLPNSVQKDQKNEKQPYKIHPSWWGDSHQTSRDTIDMMIEEKSNKAIQADNANTKKNRKCINKGPVILSYTNHDLKKEGKHLKPMYSEIPKTDIISSNEAHLHVPKRPIYYKNPLNLPKAALPTYLHRVKSRISEDVADDKQRFYKTQLKKKISSQNGTNPIELVKYSPKNDPIEIKINKEPIYEDQEHYEVTAHGKSMMENVEGLLNSTLINQFSNEQSKAYAYDGKQEHLPSDMSPKEPLTASFNTRGKNKEQKLLLEEKENRNNRLHDNLTSKKSDKYASLSSNRSNELSEAPEVQDSNPYSEMGLSPDTEKKEEVYKSVTSLPENEHIRKRVDSMPLGPEKDI